MKSKRLNAARKSQNVFLVSQTGLSRHIKGRNMMLHLRFDSEKCVAISLAGKVVQISGTQQGPKNSTEGHFGSSKGENPLQWHMSCLTCSKIGCVLLNDSRILKYIHYL